MAEFRPNEISRKLAGIIGLNSFIGNNSSARLQMFGSHLTQMPVIKGSTVRSIQTGMEREYGKYTFSKKISNSVEVVRVINRYRETYEEDRIRMNPQTIVIFEDVATKEIGMLDLPTFCSHHQYFGFLYKNQPALNGLREGAFLAPDTKLLDSPSVTPEGDYKFGRECNVAFMSMPAVSEDGILISRDMLPAFGINTFEHRVVEYGGKRFARNLYGTEKKYKPFPDIGDRIRPDGLLAALCPYDDLTAVVEQNCRDSMKVDYFHDKLCYVNGGGGVVVDIRVQHDIYSSQARTPEGMDVQLEKYDNGRRQFYQELLDLHKKLRQQRGDSLVISKELHRLLVEATAVMDKNEKQKVDKLYRLNPLDDWRIEFVVQYDITPTVGFKLTGTNGDKGVICKIAEPHEMPVDQDGNRADIVMDPNSTFSRMNIGRVYEQYLNAASRDLSKKLSVQLGFRHLQPIVADQLQDVPFSVITEVWDTLLRYYQIISPARMYPKIKVLSDQDRNDHLTAVVRHGIRLYLPPENEAENTEIVRELEADPRFKPTYGPVTYIGNSGRRVTTRRKVRIGSLYILLLEKTGDDWSAVSSGKLQSFGVLSQVTNVDKYAQPTRPQAIKMFGEAEMRIVNSYTQPGVATEIIDRNNNPQTHEAILESILNADKPTNIESAVDRSKVPLGGAKPVKLIKHLSTCSGWVFSYQKHNPRFNIMGR